MPPRLGHCPEACKGGNRMRDDRLTQIARQLVNRSVALRKGEHLLISCTGAENPLVLEIIRCAYEAGGYPHLDIQNHTLKKQVLLSYDEEAARVDTAWEAARMERMDASISVVTTDNPMELGEVPAEKLALYARLVGQPVNRRRRDGAVRWCVALYPTPFYAYSAGMSLSRFEDYYFQVCCLDYGRLGEAMDRLKALMERTDRVRILRAGTDLSFSIQGISKMCSKGERNLPDGEIYTAPVRESVNGTIAFNVPSTYQGVRFEGVTLRFEEGRVAEATANHAQALRAILDIDEGAHFVGEFAFGVNPYLHTPIGQTLFDEKICGSIHLALGHALDLTDNGNRSAIHWDLVAILRGDHGGGEVYFDGALVQKDGLFLPEALAGLNPSV